MSEGKFARELEAINQTLMIQMQSGEIYLYPHDVRENMRLCGMRIDQNLPGGPARFDFDDDYEPDFGPDAAPDEEEITDTEEGDDAED